MFRKNLIDNVVFSVHSVGLIFEICLCCKCAESNLLIVNKIDCNLRLWNLYITSLAVSVCFLMLKFPLYSCFLFVDSSLGSSYRIKIVVTTSEEDWSDQCVWQNFPVKGRLPTSLFYFFSTTIYCQAHRLAWTLILGISFAMLFSTLCFIYKGHISWIENEHSFSWIEILNFCHICLLGVRMNLIWTIIPWFNGIEKLRLSMTFLLNFC